MINLVLFGPPGAGKGTQAQILAREFSLMHLSTGEMLRQEIADGSPIGHIAEEIISRGELVPDEIVIDMIQFVIEHHKEVNGFIFDGFPRTVPQAEALDRLLEYEGTCVNAMLSLEVDKAELINRLTTRAAMSGRADDASYAVIENRIEVYDEKTAPLIDYYKKTGVYTPIHGLGSIEEVNKLLVEAVKSHIRTTD